MSVILHFILNISGRYNLAIVKNHTHTLLYPKKIKHS